MGRTPCCDKAKVKRGPWSPEEDAVLKGYIESHGTGGNWIALPQKAGLKRCGKSCRLRWLNYLRPDIKHGGFTKEEDDIIWRLYNNIGSRWSVIASQLPGRTDNDVKNYWNTKLKKRMMAGNQVTTAAAAAAAIDDAFNQINQTPANIIPTATVKSEAPVEAGSSFGQYNSFSVDASEQDSSNWWINDEFLFDFGSRFPVELLSSSSSTAHETNSSFDAETKLQVT